MSVKAILFDLDGTLINSLYDIAMSVEESLAAHSFPGYQIDAYRYFVGNGMRKLVERAVPSNTSLAIVDSVYSATLANYAKNWAVKSTLYSGIREMIAELTSQPNLRLMILTNKLDAYAKEMVDYFFPEKPFCLVQGQCPDFPVKPAPDAALFMLKAYNILPEEALFVGDTNVDIQTGKNAKIPSVGVTWGFRVEEIKKSTADYIIDNPGQLLQLLH